MSCSAASERLHSHTGITVFEQESNCIGVAGFTRFHERSDTVAVLGIYIGAGFEERLDARDAADTCAKV